MNTAEIKSMSVIERIQTMESIWNSLLYDEAIMDSPEWHQDILAERQFKIERNTAEFLSITELQATRNQ